MAAPANSPIQVVLNADDFRTAREKPPGGGRTDFFEDDDAAFARHRKSILEQLSNVRASLLSQTTGALGYARVTLRRSAWAKSHRPLQALFRKDRSDIVGGDDIGQMLVELTPRVVEAISRDVLQAEPETRWAVRDGRRKASPSIRRSEVGSLTSIRLYGASDKRDFSVSDGVKWLRNARTGGAYRVELFRELPQREAWPKLADETRRLFESFVVGLNHLGPSISAQSLLDKTGAPTLAMRLDRGDQATGLRLVIDRSEPFVGVLTPFDENLERHAKLIEFLERHPLVRRISLPALPVRSETSAARRAPDSDTPLPTPAAGARYPRVGVIDGGVGEALGAWIIGKSGFLANHHRALKHGSFIGGLLVAGQILNAPEIAPESDGCEIVDMDLYPNDDDDVFDTYFGGQGVLGFLAQVGFAIEEAKTKYGVRVFNLSINALTPVQLDRYSEEAQALDQIADEHDVIIVVSAGNLSPTRERPEWAADPTAALAQLAAARDDGIQVPAESVRNVSVGALNAPGLGHCVAHAPASYSRRGPGLRAGVKPDFGQVGGSGSSKCALGTGLFSTAENGEIYASSGTSYATPFVAKTLALLDAEIDGVVPRETLLALAIHGANVPTPLRAKALSSVARHLAGFGSMGRITDLLGGQENAITLVFPSRLYHDEQLDFQFSWPSCLVSPGGKCRGRAKLTLVSRPPLDYRFGAEFVRINMTAALQQYDPDANHGRGGWAGRLKPMHLQGGSDHIYESDLIEHGLKWSSSKVSEGQMVRGRGASSTWRLTVGYLTRALEQMPAEGVPFTAILTIEDPRDEQPVFSDMRQSLQALGARLADIRAPVRIRPRA